MPQAAKRTGCSLHRREPAAGSGKTRTGAESTVLPYARRRRGWQQTRRALRIGRQVGRRAAPLAVSIPSSTALLLPVLSKFRIGAWRLVRWRRVVSWIRLFLCGSNPSSLPVNGPGATFASLAQYIKKCWSSSPNRHSQCCAQRRGNGVGVSRIPSRKRYDLWHRHARLGGSTTAGRTFEALARRLCSKVT